MAKPFFLRLKEYYTQVGKVLRGEAGAASIFKNTTDIGISRERIYMEMLKQHVPSSCNMSLGGFLFDQEGNESKQMDIIVTNDSSLQFNFHNPDGSGKSFACIDGCIAVVAVKSNLDSNQLIEALDNIASIPDKLPLTDKRKTFGMVIKGYDDWPYKVIFASDGIELEPLMNTLNQFFERNSQIPFHKRPNIIHVAGKYVIVRIEQEGRKTRGGNKIEPNTFYPMSETTDVLGLFETILSIQRIALGAKYVVIDYDEMHERIPL
jgi:hypothetical protein